MGFKTDKKPLTADIPSDIYDKLKKEADSCYTSIAAITRMILKEHFEKKEKREE